MSRKYIGQVNDNNFIYPNNLVYEYDTEIVHDINNNCVSGNVATFSATTFTTTGITITYDITWIQNGAEKYQMQSGDYSLVSIHMIPYGETSYRPWKLVNNLTASSSFTGTSQNFTGSFTISNTDVAVTGFTAGIYSFDIRLIGHRCILPVCANLNLIPASPTPTPTKTSTPTPTPSATLGTTPTPTPTPTVTPSTSVIVGSGYYATTSGNACTGPISGISVNFTGDTNNFCTSTSFTGNTFASQSTGIYYLAYGGNFQQISITFGSNVATVTGGGCSACATPTPTPTPSGEVVGYNYYTFTPCGGGSGVDYRTYASLILGGVYSFNDPDLGPTVSCYTVTAGSTNTNTLSTYYYIGTEGCADARCTQL